MGGGERTVRRPELDEGILAQLRRVGGEDLVQELMRLYLTHTPERMRRARRALARSDLESAAKALHSLRSSSATLGASELAAALAEVESAADRGDGDRVNRSWPGIEDQVSALLEHLGERVTRS